MNPKRCLLKELHNRSRTGSRPCQDREFCGEVQPALSYHDLNNISHTIWTFQNGPSPGFITLRINPSSLTRTIKLSQCQLLVAPLRIAVRRPQIPIQYFRNSNGPFGQTPRWLNHITPSLSWWQGQETGNTGPESDQNAGNRQSAVNVLDREESEHLPTRRIHLMGMGSIGNFIAHTLKCLPNPPPVSLMFHRKEMYDGFQNSNRIIRVINRKSETNDERSGYDVDLAEYDGEKGTVFWRHISHQPSNDDPTTPPGPEEILPSGEVRICNLIVTVRGPTTVVALKAIKHRVSAETTICLIQNGMGQVEELNREVFTDPDTRPTYMLGVISHDVYLSRQNSVIHAGIGSTAIGVMRDAAKFPLPSKSLPLSLSETDKKRMYPTDKDLYANITSRYLLRTLTRSPILVCAAFPYLDLLQLQLEKVAVNCVLNPITALLNFPNGSVVGNGALACVSRLLIAEISAVIRGLPELEGVPNVSIRFSPKRLETLYLASASRTSWNSSSMREDIRKEKDTEVAYINGYIVRRGEERGLKCVLNYMLMQLINGKRWHVANSTQHVLPYGVSEVLGNPNQPNTGVSRPIVLEDQGMPGRDEPTQIEKGKFP